MDWVQTLSIMATVIASAYYMHRDVQQDIAAQTARIDQINARTDQLYEMFTARIDQVNARTDQLYEMFIDLVKEGRK